MEELEERTGLVYPAPLHETEKPVQAVHAPEKRATLTDASDIRW